LKRETLIVKKILFDQKNRQIHAFRSTQCRLVPRKTVIPGKAGIPLQRISPAPVSCLCLASANDARHAGRNCFNGVGENSIAIGPKLMLKGYQRYANAT
jgi:hypothetical protein